MALHLPIDAASDIVERLSHQDRGGPASQLYHLDSAPHVAARVSGSFAVFSRDQEGERVEILFGQMSKAKQYSGPFDDRCFSPGGKCLLRHLYCLIDCARVTLRSLRDHFSPGGV